jgi:hypothetical protein
MSNKKDVQELLKLAKGVDRVKASKSDTELNNNVREYFYKFDFTAGKHSVSKRLLYAHYRSYCKGAPVDYPVFLRSITNLAKYNSSRISVNFYLSKFFVDDLKKFKRLLASKILKDVKNGRRTRTRTKPTVKEIDYVKKEQKEEESSQ